MIHVKLVHFSLGSLGLEITDDGQGPAPVQLGLDALRLTGGVVIAFPNDGQAPDGSWSCLWEHKTQEQIERDLNIAFNCLNLRDQ